MIAFAESLLDLLPQVLDEYIDARQLCLKQQRRLRLHVTRFTDWRAASAVSSTVPDTVVINSWLSSISTQRAPSTVNGYRQSLIGLIRFATPDGEALPRIDRIRRQREPEKINPAFTRDEIHQLLDAAPHYRPMTVRTFGRGLAGDTIMRRRPDGVPWSIWWKAFTCVGYESGQYLSDLRLIPWSAVGEDGAVTFVRHKTGKAMSFRLSHRAIAAAHHILNDDLLLPWSFDTAAYFAREWRKFCRFAGVRDLGPKSLRRSSITYTYISQGEEAARILAGHSSFTTTSRHYIDWSLAHKPIISPPPLK